MSDLKSCRVCGRTDLHIHDDESVREWQEALDKSVANHPAGKRKGKNK